jgi:hypothetical protein
MRMYEYGRDIRTCFVADICLNRLEYFLKLCYTLAVFFVIGTYLALN